MATLTTDCHECNGAGGTFTDHWGSAGHYTRDYECGTCGGTGEVTARCECCRGAEDIAARGTDGEYLCAPCATSIETEHGEPVTWLDPERKPTPATGVETMAVVVERGLR